MTILEQSNFLMSFKLMLRTNYKLENGNIPWGKQNSCIKKTSGQNSKQDDICTFIVTLLICKNVSDTALLFRLFSRMEINNMLMRRPHWLHWSTTVVQIKTCVFPQPAILSGLQPLQEGRADPPHPSQTPRSRLSPRCRCGPVTIPDWGADGDTAEETPQGGVEPKVKPAAVCTFSVSGSAPAPSSARPSKARPPDVHSRPFFFFCCLNTPPPFIYINK